MGQKNRWRNNVPKLLFSVAEVTLLLNVLYEDHKKNEKPQIGRLIVNKKLLWYMVVFSFCRKLSYY